MLNSQRFGSRDHVYNISEVQYNYSDTLKSITILFRLVLVNRPDYGGIKFSLWIHQRAAYDIQPYTYTAVFVYHLH